MTFPTPTRAPAQAEIRRELPARFNLHLRAAGAASKLSPRCSPAANGAAHAD